MKLKSLLFVCLVALFSSANAETRHVPANANSSATAKTVVKKAKMPGYCEVEILNYSRDDLSVWGRLSNNAEVSFYISRFRNFPESHIIDMYDYYYGGCPLWIDLSIITTNGYPVYHEITYPGSVIEVRPYWGAVKATSHSK